MSGLMEARLPEMLIRSSNRHTLSFFKKGNELREDANHPQRRVACRHILKMAVSLSFSQSEQACVQTNEGKTVRVQYDIPQLAITK